MSFEEKDSLIHIKVTRKDTYLFGLPSSLRLLDGISPEDSVTIVFINGKLVHVEVQHKESPNERVKWHVTKSINNMIEKLEKAY